MFRKSSSVVPVKHLTNLNNDNNKQNNNNNNNNNIDDDKYVNSNGTSEKYLVDDHKLLEELDLRPSDDISPALMSRRLQPLEIETNEYSVHNASRRSAMANIVKDIVIHPADEKQKPFRIESMKVEPLYYDELERITSQNDIRADSNNHNNNNNNNNKAGLVVPTPKRRNLSYFGTTTKDLNSDVYIKPEGNQSSDVSPSIGSRSITQIQQHLQDNTLEFLKATTPSASARNLSEDESISENRTNNIYNYNNNDNKNDNKNYNKKDDVIYDEQNKPIRMRSSDDDLYRRESVRPNLDNYPSYFLRKQKTHRKSVRNIIVEDEDGGGYFNSLPIIIPTESEWLRYFITLLVLIAIYDLLFIPYRIAFGQSLSLSHIFLSVDMFSDALYIISFVLQFRIAYFIHSTVVISPKRIYERYSKSWMILDIIGLIPFDLIQLIYFKWIPLVRLAKLTRISMFFRYKVVHLLHSTTTPGVDDKRRHLQYVFKLMFFMIVTGHVLSCIKFILHKAEGLQSWSEANFFDLMNASNLRLYLLSLLWTMNILTGLGSNPVPDSYLENLLTDVIMISGVLLFAYIVGKTSALLQLNNISRRTFQEKLHFLGKFMADNKLPPKLQTEVTRYFHYVWTANRGLDGMNITSNLLPSLRTDVRLHFYRSVAEQSFVFRDVEEGFIRSLTNHLYSSICVPNQYIIHANAVISNKMYFIKEGSVHILIGNKLNQHVVKALNAGDHFGEYALLGISGSKRSASVRAATYCTLIVLQKDSLLRVMAQYPYSARIIMERCEANWKFMQTQDRQFVDDEVTFLFGELKGWKKVRRYVLLRKVIGWMKSPPKLRYIIIHPHSKQLSRWKVFMLSVVLWNALTIPFRCAFTFSYNHPWVIIFDIIFDLCHWIDIWVNFHTGYFHKGTYITSLATIRKRYLSHAFIIHFLTILPLDILMLWWGMNPLLRLNRLLGMISVALWLQQALEGSNKFYFYNFLRLLAILSLVAHWVACIYFGFTKFRGYGTISNDDWLPVKEIDDAPRLHQYLRATYFSFSLLTGFGRHPNPVANSEIIFTIITMIMGIFLIANLISTMSTVLANMDVFADRFSKQVKLLDGFLTTSGYPKNDLYRRIQKYFVHLWHAHHGVDPNLVLDSLPKPLRTDVALHLFGNMLEEVPQFVGLSTEVIEDLAYRLEIVEVPPNEIIFHLGDYGNEIFFIQRGLVELIGMNVNEDNVTYKELARSSFFGEMSMKYHHRACTARSMTPVTLLRLHRRDYYKLTQAHPTFKKVMLKTIAKRNSMIKASGLVRRVEKKLPEDILLKKKMEEMKQETLKSKKLWMKASPSEPSIMNRLRALDTTTDNDISTIK